MPKWAKDMLAAVAVIVVFLFVVSILFSRPSSSSTKALQIACLSNERQLGLAIQAYAEDNDLTYPNIAGTPAGTDTWRVAIYPYAKTRGVYLCPARTDKANGPDGFPRSYAANCNGDCTSGENGICDGAFGGIGSKGVRVKDIDQPGNLIMLCEFAGGNTPEFNIDDPIHFGPAMRLLWAGHGGGSNYLLADGDVRWLKPLTTTKLWHRDSRIPLSANGMAVLAETSKRAGD
jgi:prepilin-type processing-associated H-X9-DG protein